MFKGIVSRDFAILFWFNWIDMKFLIGPDQVNFNFTEIFVFKFLKKLTLSVYRIWSCWSKNCYNSKDFSRILIFLRWIPRLWGGNSRQILHLSYVLRVLAHRILNILRMVTIPGFITPVKLWSMDVGTLRSKLPPDGNYSRIHYSCVVQEWHTAFQKSSGW
jgi:hypothetical protein